jgi:hypothetical protein
VPRGAELHHIGSQWSIAVGSALAEAGSPPVDVLDAHGFELVGTRVASLTVVHGVNHLVKQRCHRVAHDRPSRIAVAASLKLRAELGIPDDRSRLVRVVRLQQVAAGIPSVQISERALARCSSFSMTGAPDRSPLRSIGFDTASIPVAILLAAAGARAELVPCQPADTEGS